MPEFRDLDSLYKYVEENALDFSYLIEIAELFQKLRDIFNAEGEQGKALVAQYEVDAFNLMAKDGRLGAQFIGTDPEGNEVRIPDITKFTSEELDYFSERLKHTDNPRLKARYAHILWESKLKRQHHATNAIVAYLNQIPHFENLNKANDNDSPNAHFYHRDIFECITSSLNLAVSSRQKTDKVVSEVWRLIQDSHSDNQTRISFVDDLIALALNNKKHFEPQKIESLTDICLSVADRLRETGDLHGAIRINELGLRINRSLKLKTSNWNQRIAECYEMLTERREKSPIVAAEWCQRAMDYYREAGNKSKLDELALKREKFGGEVEFHVISTKFDLTGHIAQCEKIGKELAEHSTHEILSFIASDPNLLPSKADMELHARESAKASPLLSIIAETIMDDRMHVAAHAVTPEEKLKRGILQGFDFYLRNDKIYLINAIIYNGFRAGRLDADKILESLRDTSWIGSTLKKQKGTNKDYCYCWLDLLAPSVRSYFTYIKQLIERVEPDEPPILAIDSLTLKFEGLVRDYAQLHGIPTHRDKKHANGTITQEKDLTLLLNDPRIAGLFNPDDLLFFKFLFVEQSGITLRHEVAHCLLGLEDYHFSILQLLFVALMRLAKYHLPDNDHTHK